MSRPVLIISDRYRVILISTGCVPTCTDHVRLTQSDSDRYRVGHIGTGWVTLVQGGSHWYRVGHMGTGWVTSVQGGSHRYRVGHMGTGWVTLVLYFCYYIQSRFHDDL